MLKLLISVFCLPQVRLGSRKSLKPTAGLRPRRPACDGRQVVGSQWRVPSDTRFMLVRSWFPIVAGGFGQKHSMIGTALAL